MTTPSPSTSVAQYGVLLAMLSVMGESLVRVQAVKVVMLSYSKKKRGLKQDRVMTFDMD